MSRKNPFVGQSLKTLQSRRAEILAELHDVQTILQNIEEAIGENVADQLQLKRDFEKQSTGTVSVIIDGFEVSSVVPKRVTWDNDMLEEIFAEIEMEDPGCNVLEWADYKITIPETKYKKLPVEIRSRVDAARVVKHGKEKIELKEINDD